MLLGRTERNSAVVYATAAFGVGTRHLFARVALPHPVADSNDQAKEQHHDDRRWWFHDGSSLVGGTGSVGGSARMGQHSDTRRMGLADLIVHLLYRIGSYTECGVVVISIPTYVKVVLLLLGWFHLQSPVFTV